MATIRLGNAALHDATDLSWRVTQNQPNLSRQS